jgi:hypothetical protein
MDQMDSPWRQALQLSQRARALGRYNEATIILDDFISEHPAASSGITIHIEFALNYLAQGYLARANEVLLRACSQAAGGVRGVKDPERALFDLLLAVVKFRHQDLTSVDACESECFQVWKEHLLGQAGYTETHVGIFGHLGLRELTVMYPIGQT